MHTRLCTRCMLAKHLFNPTSWLWHGLCKYNAASTNKKRFNQLNPAKAMPYQAHKLTEVLARFQAYEARHVWVLPKNVPDLGKKIAKLIKSHNPQVQARIHRFRRQLGRLSGFGQVFRSAACTARLTLCNFSACTHAWANHNGPSSWW